jgi:hypothetical protein
MRPWSQPLVSSPLNPNAGLSTPGEGSKEASSSSSHSNSAEAIGGRSGSGSGSGSGSIKPPHDGSSRDSSYAALPVLTSSGGFDPSFYNSRSSYAEYSRYSVGPAGDHVPDPELGFDPRKSGASSFVNESQSHNSILSWNNRNSALIWNEANKEADDYLHEPGANDRPKKEGASSGTFLTPERMCVGGISWRGLLNVGGLIALVGAVVGVFLGYPIGYCTCARLSFFPAKLTSASSFGQMYTTEVWATSEPLVQAVSTRPAK